MPAGDEFVNSGGRQLDDEGAGPPIEGTQRIGG
jgi:hypothetical protein